MAVRIRKGTQRDYPGILELFREFAHFEKLPELMVNSLERLQQEKKHFHCFVAVEPGGSIAGYATWFYAYFTWSGKAIYMDDLYVKPAYRGLGIGLRLIRKVMEQGRASGCHKMRWQVADWNEQAIGFYEKLGAVRDPVNRNCDLEL